MTIPFRAIYRIFLFRVVDTDLLATSGDPSRLMGQIAVIPFLLGIGFAFGAMGMGGATTPRSEMLISAWGLEHSLIATSILLTSLFTVLSWESAYPDLKDIMVLGTLPVQPRTLFLAKIAALGSAQATVIATLTLLPALTWPLAMAPPSRTLLDLIFMPEAIRAFFALWITTLSAGAFVVLSVTATQGLLAHLLTRHHYLRTSAWLQLLFFCAMLAAYFLQPVPPTVQALANPANRTLLQWSPAYWFLGLFQLLNGSMHPVMQPLATLAIGGLCCAAVLSLLVNGLTYPRRLRQIVEEPELSPRLTRRSWTPRLGPPTASAIFQFVCRTLSRSRQHRLLLALYVGAALSTVVLLIKTGAGRGVLSPLQQTRTALASVIVASAWVLGLRAVSGIPVMLKANWVFQITQLHPPHAYLAASRRSLQVIAVVPPLLLTIAIFAWLWPWRAASVHLAVMTLWCLGLSECAFWQNRTIPFTCSLRPGKSAFHLRLLAAIGAILALGKAAEHEQRALHSWPDAAAQLTVLTIVAVVARLAARIHPTADSTFVEFEDCEAPAIQQLGLTRDGRTIQPAQSGAGRKQ
jgi:hypothetical protein